MTTPKKIRSIKGNLKTVLSVFDEEFKSIKGFMKANPDLSFEPVKCIKPISASAAIGYYHDSVRCSFLNKFSEISWIS